jgi:hypothetical protein
MRKNKNIFPRMGAPTDAAAACGKRESGSASCSHSERHRADLRAIPVTARCADVWHFRCSGRAFIAMYGKSRLSGAIAGRTLNAPS